MNYDELVHFVHAFFTRYSYKAVLRLRWIPAGHSLSWHPVRQLEEWGSPTNSISATSFRSKSREHLGCKSWEMLSCLSITCCWVLGPFDSSVPRGKKEDAGNEGSKAECLTMSSHVITMFHGSAPVARIIVWVLRVRPGAHGTGGSLSVLHHIWAVSGVRQKRLVEGGRLCTKDWRGAMQMRRFRRAFWYNIV
jgi:hypothetical protein